MEFTAEEEAKFGWICDMLADKVVRNDELKIAMYTEKRDRHHANALMALMENPVPLTKTDNGYVPLDKTAGVRRFLGEVWNAVRPENKENPGMNWWGALGLGGAAGTLEATGGRDGGLAALGDMYNDRMMRRDPIAWLDQRRKDMNIKAGKTGNKAGKQYDYTKAWGDLFDNVRSDTPKTKDLAAFLSDYSGGKDWAKDPTGEKFAQRALALTKDTTVDFSPLSKPSERLGLLDDFLGKHSAPSKTQAFKADAGRLTNATGLDFYSGKPEEIFDRIMAERGSTHAELLTHSKQFASHLQPFVRNSKPLSLLNRARRVGAVGSVGAMVGGLGIPVLLDNAFSAK